MSIIRLTGTYAEEVFFSHSVCPTIDLQFCNSRIPLKKILTCSSYSQWIRKQKYRNRFYHFEMLIPLPVPCTNVTLFSCNKKKTDFASVDHRLFGFAGVYWIIYLLLNNKTKFVFVIQSVVFVRTRKRCNVERIELENTCVFGFDAERSRKKVTCRWKKNY